MIKGFRFCLQNVLILIINSSMSNVTKAPTGSNKANTPLIMPKELPMKKPNRKIIASNEYLLHGLAAQYPKLIRNSDEYLYNFVDCILEAIFKGSNSKTAHFFN